MGFRDCCGNELPNFEAFMDHMREDHGMAFEHGGMTDVGLTFVCPCGQLHGGRASEDWNALRKRWKARDKEGMQDGYSHMIMAGPTGVLNDANADELVDDGTGVEARAASNHMSTIVRCGKCGMVTILTACSHLAAMQGDDFDRMVSGMDIDVEVSEGQDSGFVEYYGAGAKNAVGNINAPNMTGGLATTDMRAHYEVLDQERERALARLRAKKGIKPVLH